jgi:hypothetical protein
VRSDLKAPRLPVVIGVMGIGGEKEAAKPPQRHFRQAQSAVAALPEFVGTVAAVLFSLLGEPDHAGFFTRLSVASHASERDGGHTGNHFNMVWAMPGVALAGPHATGAWMNEFGSWYFDLARRSDGSFLHQGRPEPEPDSYEGWWAPASAPLGPQGPSTSSP